MWKKMIEKDIWEKMRQKRSDDLEMAVESEEEMEPKSSEKRWVGERGAKKLQTGYLLKGCHCQGCLNKMP